MVRPTLGRVWRVVRDFSFYLRGGLAAIGRQCLLRVYVGEGRIVIGIDFDQLVGMRLEQFPCALVPRQGRDTSEKGAGPQHGMTALSVSASDADRAPIGRLEIRQHPVNERG